MCGSGSWRRWPTCRVCKLNEPVLALLSYAFANNQTLKFIAERPHEFALLIDCGAYTAMTRGREVSLDEYCTFISGLPFKPVGYLALDVIGDPVATRRNYEIMHDRGLRPIPVITRGGTLEDEIDFYQRTATYIAFGGFTGSRTQRAGYCVRIMNEVRRRGLHAHLLGYTQLDHIKALRPYSCDSSSWTNALRYGHISVYMGGGRFELVTRKAFAHGVPQHLEAAVQRIGASMYPLRAGENWRGYRSLSAAISTASNILAARDAVKAIGVRIHLAATTPNMWRVLSEARAMIP